MLFFRNNLSAALSWKCCIPPPFSLKYPRVFTSLFSPPPFHCALNLHQAFLTQFWRLRVISSSSIVLHRRSRLVSSVEVIPLSTFCTHAALTPLCFTPTRGWTNLSWSHWPKNALPVFIRLLFVLLQSSVRFSFWTPSIEDDVTKFNSVWVGLFFFKIVSC